MKKNFILFWKAFFFAVVIFLFASCGDDKKIENYFPDWNADSSVIKVLIEYVEKVTNPKSPDFIPKEDRIVVSDMDGTLCGEKAPIYTSWKFYADYVFNHKDSVSPENLKVAEIISEAAKTGIIPDDLEKRHALALAEVFKGTSIEEFRTLFREFLNRPSDGFENIKIGDEFFIPMIEICRYLEKNDFTVYICSGTDRDFTRIAQEKSVKLPFYHVIGTDTFLESEKQLAENSDGLDYIYGNDEKIVRSGKFLIKTVKANKVSQIMQEIGQKPVLAFGNSTGDISMNQLVTNGNKYKSLAFMVLADDEEREYGNYEKAIELKKKWDSYGWNTISMKNDFKTIYGTAALKKN